MWILKWDGLRVELSPFLKKGLNSRHTQNNPFISFVLTTGTIDGETNFSDAIA
jgi:hypothetical protein